MSEEITFTEYTSNTEIKPESLTYMQKNFHDREYSLEGWNAICELVEWQKDGWTPAITGTDVRTSYHYTKKYSDFLKLARIPRKSDKKY